MKMPMIQTVVLTLLIPVEHHLHVISDIWIPVFIDSQAGTCVKQLDVHDPNLKTDILK